MSPELRARLQKEAEQPAGVAPVLDSPELKQLLDEHKDLLDTLNDVWLDVEAHQGSGGWATELAARLVRTHGEHVKAALRRARK